MHFQKNLAEVVRKINIVHQQKSNLDQSTLVTNLDLSTVAYCSCSEETAPYAQHVLAFMLFEGNHILKKTKTA
jgi:hypothetical protein